MFSLCERLFGIRVQQRSNKYTEPGNKREHVFKLRAMTGRQKSGTAACAFDLYDSQSDTKLGAFYTDWFPVPQARRRMDEPSAYRRPRARTAALPAARADCWQYVRAARTSLR